MVNHSFTSTLSDLDTCGRHARTARPGDQDACGEGEDLVDHGQGISCQ